MQLQGLVRWVVLTPVLLAGCNSDSGVTSGPTAPTTSTSVVAEAPLSLQGITMVPDSTGVQYNTDFQFSASGSFPAGTQFVWNFGDGSSTTTSTPSVSRIYGQAGVFNVSVEARQGAQSGLGSKQVSVRSMLGRWIGKVTGFTHFPLQRPVAMTGFELLVVNQTLDGSSLMLHGRWADDSGCRETKVENIRQRLEPSPTATVTFGVNALSCADGDFYLSGLADAKFDRVEGQCNVVGNNPNCRFTMTRE